jgi:hypothetical protein
LKLLRDFRADGEVGARIQDHVKWALAVEHHLHEDAVVDPLEVELAWREGLGCLRWSRRHEKDGHDYLAPEKSL